MYMYILFHIYMCIVFSFYVSILFFPYIDVFTLFLMYIHALPFLPVFLVVTLQM